MKRRQDGVSNFSHGKPDRKEYRKHVTAMLAKGCRPNFYGDWVVMTEAIHGLRSVSSVRVMRRAMPAMRADPLTSHRCTRCKRIAMLPPDASMVCGCGGFLALEA
jgi:hypothetical protein